jgi:hypothetical protein
MATNVPNITLSGTGAVGASSGLYLTGAGGGGGVNWINAASTYTTYANTVPSFSNDVVIRRDGKPDIKIAETLEMLMDRLCVIVPAMELIEKYPALRDAYENYKLIEAMVKNGKDEDEL